MILRDAAPADLPRIREILDQAINAGFRTAHLETPTAETLAAWLAVHSPERWPVVVLEEDGVITGWACISKYRAGRLALEGVGVVSYFVDFALQRGGRGARLMEHLVERARALPFHSLMAILIDGNDGSLALLRRFGFSEWGRLPGVVRMRGEARDHLYWGRTL